jgi:hypothetical protein
MTRVHSVVNLINQPIEGDVLEIRVFDVTGHDFVVFV